MSFGKKPVDAFTVMAVLLALLSLILGLRKMYGPAELPGHSSTSSFDSAPSDMPAVVDVPAPMNAVEAALCRQEHFATYRELLKQDDPRCPLANPSPSGFKGAWNSTSARSDSDVGNVANSGQSDVAVERMCVEGYALYVVYRNRQGVAPGIGHMAVTSTRRGWGKTEALRQSFDVEMPLPGAALRAGPIDVRLLRLESGNETQFGVTFTPGEGVRDPDLTNNSLSSVLEIDRAGSTCEGSPPPIARNADELWSAVSAAHTGGMRIACRREIWASSGKWLGANDPPCDYDAAGSEGAPGPGAP
jgi:hypothetical protein